MPLWEPIDEAGRVRRAEYRFGSAGRATCSTVDLGGGRMALFSPPGGADAGPLYDELGGYGEVVAVVAPNAYHRMGLPAAAARYPGAELFAPEKAVARVGKKLEKGKVVRPLEDLQPRLPEDVEVFVPPFMKSSDTMVRVSTGLGVVWTIHDVILNMEVTSTNAVERWALGLLGYKPGLRVNRFGIRFVLVADRPAFSRWLREELERVPPAAMVAGHGPPLREPALLARLPELAGEIGEFG